MLEGLGRMTHLCKRIREPVWCRKGESQEFRAGTVHSPLPHHDLMTVLLACAVKQADLTYCCSCPR